MQQKLKIIPKKPGVYIYKNTAGNVLYVGKAKLLHNRVRSYFRKRANLDPFKQDMVKKIADIETITTDTEHEALILEATLIQKHKPKYNVVMRDDKYYQFIKITKEDIPRIFLTRRIRNDKAKYFGPYSSSQSVRATLRLLRRIFPFKGEKETPRDIIFPHPLFQQNTENNIRNIIRFLKGERNEITKTLQKGMKKAAKKKEYERAAIFRDQLQAIQKLDGLQKVYLTKEESFDSISMAHEKTQSAGNIFQVRKGKLLNKNTFLLRHHSKTTPQDILRQFLLQYYNVAQDKPNIIHIPYKLKDNKEIAEWIQKEKPPKLTTPKRGKKKQLMSMGEENATNLLDAQAIEFQTDHKLKQAQKELTKALGLKNIHRTEIYDVSNIQGKLATASMAVFIDGKPQPNQYRKFRIKLSNTPNDYAMLQETLARRFMHQQKNWQSPDLILIDGGKGQLSTTKKVLDTLNIDIPIAAIAKREEEIFMPNKEPIKLENDSSALHLIQRMRDEAHRFTITYHRLLRSKQQHQSILDEIPTIGPKTKKQLIRHFGSLKGIRNANQKELETIIGKKKSEKIREYL